jgi:hypothetical protein
MADAGPSSPTKAPESKSPKSKSPAPETGILPASHWEDVSFLTPNPVATAYHGLISLSYALQIVDQEDVYDGDSGFGTDAASSTASLTSSILQYRTHLGRTYHSEIGIAEGWTPNDEKHAESMDLQ